MFAFKSHNEKLRSVRLGSIRMIEAMKARAVVSDNIEKWREACEVMSAAKQNRATRVRRESLSNRLDRIGTVNAWVDFKRDNATKSKIATSEEFINKTDASLGLRMNGASKRLDERDGIARQISLSEAVKRAKIIQSIAKQK